jgi:BirA family transcriptional regulator, biotin operon repressor / biotin---[acetyl-CoA-carboxylase] ligase
MNTKRYHFPSINSTNNWVKEHIDDLDITALTLVTADEQTAGRGSRNRKWVSPPERNVYATFAFFLKGYQPDICNISQVTAVAAAEVLKQLGFEAQCKWPNDLFLGKKKVGGILCETCQHGNLVCVLIGIGINVNMPAHILDTIDQLATSFQVERGREYLPEIVIELLDHHFKESLNIFLKQGFEPFFKKYQALLIYRPHQPVTINDDQTIWKGLFHSIQPDGSIAILLPSHEIKNFRSGDIDVIPSIF